MGTFSIWHWLIVLVVVLVLFGGGGKIPKLMRDMGNSAYVRDTGRSEGAGETAPPAIGRLANLGQVVHRERGVHGPAAAPQAAPPSSVRRATNASIASARSCSSGGCSYSTSNRL